MAEWRSRDHLAEFWVAGKLVDAGWNVYFPHRDKGFDLIATYTDGAQMQLRPIQVKGKYPKEGTRNRKTYGFRASLSAMHERMVLAIPMFVNVDDPMPLHVAWMPREKIVQEENGNWRCEPAKFKDGVPIPRQEFEQYFDQGGLELLKGI